MLSKSGKVEWTCPDCDSKDIEHTVTIWKRAWHCINCNHYGPWRSRIKRGVSYRHTRAFKRIGRGMELCIDCEEPTGLDFKVSLYIDAEHECQGSIGPLCVCCCSKIMKEIESDV